MQIKKRTFSDTRIENLASQDKAKSYSKGVGKDTEYDNDGAESSRIDDRSEWSDRKSLLEFRR
jgi:hypothetical protein